MDIKGTLNYNFTLGESKFSYSAEVNNQSALISLCLSKDMIEKFEAQLKNKRRKTATDKHNLTCLKNTAYIMRQFVQGAVADLINENKDKIEPIVEAVTEPVNTEDNG